MALLNVVGGRDDKEQGWGRAMNSRLLLPTCETSNSLRITLIFEDLSHFLKVSGS